jgi:hypothetical protein
MQVGLQTQIGVQKTMTHKKFPKQKKTLMPTETSKYKVWNFISSLSFKIPEEPASLTDEELLYIAYAINETDDEGKKKIVNLIHLECDENTVCRFHDLFSDEERSQIMYNC